MSIADIFSTFLDNLKVDNAEVISSRYGEITLSLNKYFRNTDSRIDNSLQVGSYGRHTGIKGISDLDMLYIMPNSSWNNYKDGKQYELLKDTRDAILQRYQRTNIVVDRLVVCIKYLNFHIEVQPVFEINDEQGERCFKYPDTYNGGSWKITKPIHEIQAMKEFVDQKNKNLRKLCKMTRAWKNKHGINMGGLLIDTLAYNFLKLYSDYDDKSFYYYDWMSRDFFKYLSEEPNKDYYLALGSNQRVKVKKKFQKKAKEAYDLCLDAIAAEKTDSVNEKWKKIYGHFFPGNKNISFAAESLGKPSPRNTEEFVENLHPVDIYYNLQIDCEVSQNGFREYSLWDMIKKHIPLLANKHLKFYVTECDVPTPYILKWKVLNRGPEAERRDMIRGQIVNDKGSQSCIEHTSFKGNHIVECYAIRDSVVVARASIDVPIQTNQL